MVGDFYRFRFEHRRSEPHSLALAAREEDFYSLELYATALLAVAEGERSSILRAVLAAIELMRSSIHMLELIQNRATRQWLGSNHRQSLTTNTVHFLLS